ncbi:Transposon Ty3-G Gag-Pol poly [Paramuricea clavata]|uniref:Transposon Ty3-G Gag-Pol poly n=1 Tax=Paramuricea clavata TaxID=317549 RepID=A0A7D9DJE7_PARCT|nr:Transposon Ty3-G Gag-Pol poly [Paramuricea clavata]
MELSDTLSRAYLHEGGIPVEIEVESINVMHSLLVDSARLDVIRASMETDERMQELKKVILKGWPDKRSDVPGQARQYFGVRDELTVQEGLIFRGERMLVPNDLRKQMIQRIHSTHIGADGCLGRARESIYWPGLTRDIKDHTAQCDVCFWEIDLLENVKAKTVIRKMKSKFARYGVPDLCVSDNGPQFVSEEYHKISESWKFQRVTSSPRHPQSNGRVENAVQAVKRG